MSKAYGEEGGELLPVLLSRACVTVLPIAGAGLSLMDELRVPIGASDGEVDGAERLQTTLGEGPCLAAAEAMQPLIFGQVAIADRWPIYWTELFRQTPFRSVASFPLRTLGGRHLGALDLYSTNPDSAAFRALGDVVSAVVDPIADILFDEPVTAEAQSGLLPLWLGVNPARRRMNVWVAIGILVEYANFSNRDALAVLRAHAFAVEASLDDVADRMMSRRLRPEALVRGDG